MNTKSSVEQIRARFDADVERFSNLETGQTAMVDSPLCMELVTAASLAVTPNPKDLLDIGCGAGNYTLKLLEWLKIPRTLNCTLIDLSKPMLDRAVQRITPHTKGRVVPLQGDMREIPLADGSFDIVLAASTLHHLRTDEEWQAMFGKIYRSLRPGGSFWVFDLIQHNNAGVEELLMQRYGDYLSSLKGGGPGGRSYRDHVFNYIAEEDTPRPVTYQIDVMRQVGFVDPDILHKSVMGAAFGARKG